MLDQMIYRINRKLKSVIAPQGITDDFDWGLYNHLYRDEVKETQKVHTLKLLPDDYGFTNNNLIKLKEVLPLHPNHRLVYETVLQLQPESLMEVGCGGGYHLHNISLLSPETRIYGCDLSSEQIKFLKSNFPDLSTNVEQVDITLPHSCLLPVVDVVYTQAVIMHIQTGNAHMVAMANLFEIATKQVLLMENWSRHNFMDDIKFMFDKKMIPWSNLFFYYRRAPELNNKPHLMVISASPLNYEPLTDYRDIVSGVSKYQ